MSYQKLKPLLWCTTQREKPVYFLGTEHWPDDWERRVPKSLLKAFDASDCLCVEIDDAAVDLSDPAVTEAGKQIPAAVSAEFSKRTRKLRRTRGSSVVMRASPGRLVAYRKEKPAVAVLPQRRAGRRTPLENLGLDGFLMARAREKQKLVTSLESLAEQLQALSTITLQDADPPDLGRAIQQVPRAFLARDVGYLTMLTEQLYTPMGCMWGARHVRVARRLLALLQETPKTSYFVAVGLSHLLGPVNILELLDIAGLPTEKVGW